MPSYIAQGETLSKGVGGGGERGRGVEGRGRGQSERGYRKGWGRVLEEGGYEGVWVGERAGLLLGVGREGRGVEEGGAGKVGWWGGGRGRGRGEGGTEVDGGEGKRDI